MNYSPDRCNDNTRYSSCLITKLLSLEPSQSFTLTLVLKENEIYYFQFFQSSFLTIVRHKEIPQMGRMYYLESVFLKLKLLFRF